VVGVGSEEVATYSPSSRWRALASARNWRCAVRHDRPSNPAETSSTATPTGTLVSGSGWRRLWTPSAIANNPPTTKMPTAASSDQK
jgi:hypothetical protein